MPAGPSSGTCRRKRRRRSRALHSAQLGDDSLHGEFMRITGGLHRGRTLATPKGRKIRPSSDRVREALFNLLGQDLRGCRVLDLFAGTGSLGLEALSRGAVLAVFVDRAGEAVGLIRENLALCGLEHAGKVMKRRLEKGAPWDHELLQAGFDVVFLDPPYGKGYLLTHLEDIGNRGLLLPGGCVITESSKGKMLPEAFGRLRQLDKRDYGNTRLTFYSP